MRRCLDRARRRRTRARAGRARGRRAAPTPRLRPANGSERLRRVSRSNRNATANPTSAAIARQAMGIRRSGTRANRSGGNARHRGSYRGTFAPRASTVGTTAASARNTARPLLPRIAHSPTRARIGVSHPRKTNSSMPAPTPRVKRSEISAEYRSTSVNFRPRPTTDPATTSCCTAIAAAVAAATPTPAFHHSERGTRAHAYPSARITAPIARWICPESGIAASASPAHTNLRRSSARSTAGRRNAISPRRWPVD